MSYEQITFHHKHHNKKVFLVDTKSEYNRHYSELMTRGINKTLRRGESVLIISNQTSYASGLICDQCGYIPQCKQCDISISYHQPDHGASFGMCHICKSYYKNVIQCKQCKKGKMKPYGIGIEQIAHYIQGEYKIKPIIIKSSTANSLPKIHKIGEKIHSKTANTNHNPQVIIATSLVITSSISFTSTPHLSPGLTILLHADRPLLMPDYNAQSNCFHLIHDTIISSPHENIIIQTSKPDHPTVRMACAGEYKQFTQQDEQRKKEHHYPPYGDICILMYKNEIEQRVFTTINKLYQELLYLKEKTINQTHNAQNKNNNQSSIISIYATPPLIYKTYNRYRYNIIIRGTNIRSFVEHAFVTLNIASKGFKLDRQAREIL